MKYFKYLLINLLFMAVIPNSNLNAQQAEEEITKVLTKFAHAADNNQTKSLEQLLFNDFRIVWPQPDADPFIVDRKTYLAKIASKEWGGDQRKLNIHWIKTNGSHGSAYVQLSGKADMHSFIDLVQIKGDWKIIQDAVQMK